MKGKLLSVLVIAGLVAIFIVENSDQVNITFLGWKVSAARQQLYPGLVIAGFVAGAIFRSMFGRQRYVVPQEGTSASPEELE
jgi:uncharacterized integral membrane protein